MKRQVRVSLIVRKKRRCRLRSKRQEGLFLLAGILFVKRLAKETALEAQRKRSLTVTREMVSAVAKRVLKSTKG